MTDAQLEEFCRLNEMAQVERTREGVIRLNAPAGTEGSDGNAELTTQLREWWKTHRRGRVYDSSGGFSLPDSSMLSPDGAYCTLMSETDRLAAAKRKMELWLENGARVGWLVDPKRRQVWVYESGKTPEAVSGACVEGSGPVEGFRLELNEVWDCYED